MKSNEEEVKGGKLSPGQAGIGGFLEVQTLTQALKNSRHTVQLEGQAMLQGDPQRPGGERRGLFRAKEGVSDLGERLALKWPGWEVGVKR